MLDNITDDEALDAEFDAMASRAGLTIPEDRRLVLLLGLKNLKRMTAMMRRPRKAADEPANAYDILSVTRNA